MLYSAHTTGMFLNIAASECKNHPQEPKDINVRPMTFPSEMGDLLNMGKTELQSS